MELRREAARFSYARQPAADGLVECGEIDDVVEDREVR